MSEIQGFMPAAGLELLRQLATGRRVVEVGVWKGRTALAMAETARSVWAIDHFRGDRYTGVANTLPECWQNIRDHPMGDRVRLLAARWEELWPVLDLAQFDLLFYDGDHDYEPTAHWLADTLGRANPSAVVVLDDYASTYPQVIQAVADCLPGCQRRVRVEGAICILEPIG